MAKAVECVVNKSKSWKYQSITKKTKKKTKPKIPNQKYHSQVQLSNSQNASTDPPKTDQKVAHVPGQLKKKKKKDGKF